MKSISLQHIIPEALANHRLDVVLSQLFPDYSRSQIQHWIKAGSVLVDSKIIQKPRHAVLTGQNIQIDVELPEQTECKAQAIPLDIIYEDESLIVINKSVGLIVHPGAGNPDNTLVNALLHYAPELSLIPRAGVIHRLDKDTSGLLVIARTLPVHNRLIKDMQARKIHREYRAIVQGRMISGGTVDMPMARHPNNRLKMAVVNSGKEAVTHYRVLERFAEHTLLNVQLETGRTHQIRVHLAHIKYPIVGDATYARQRQFPKLSQDAQNALRKFNHQALHAYRLALTHPSTKKPIEWIAPIPDDIEKLLSILRE
ncbi:MAG: RNA pseudouridine synthase [Gammaproteobacteria bacterium RIFCSPHIGHO2_12_FULL_38_11]|nr:MAG: RNA pseudouridine synthase [Gammaproteobacteria bacterium RIFCSPHIGHO2_12_FULL_38_11]